MTGVLALSTASGEPTAHHRPTLGLPGQVPSPEATLAVEIYRTHGATYQDYVVGNRWSQTRIEDLKGIPASLLHEYPEHPGLTLKAFQRPVSLMTRSDR